MRLLSILLFACSLLMISCGDDELPANIIHLDGENASAPFFEPGFNEAAVQFSANIMDDYIDREIKSVRFYLFEVPDACEVAIYESAGNSPGVELYSFNFTANASPNGWNIHVLPTPLAIDGNELWVSIKMTNGESVQAMGCDAGPARAGGDWLFESTTSFWNTFRTVTEESVSINWNIRLDLVEL